MMPTAPLCEPPYLDKADLLADPAVQAVYIASPVHCHARQIALAAQAGWTLSREWISAQPRFAIFLLSAA